MSDSVNTFRRFLEKKSEGIRIDRKEGKAFWDVPVNSSEANYTGFLEFAYSTNLSGDYVYLDRSTAFEIVNRLNWMESKIKRLVKRERIMILLLSAVLIIAVLGWLT
ncbi:MAG: hypothetical protein QXS51_02395 [Thermoproteota archaeon]|nr:hypothetical protein [Candidatus Brockarchaeota archaeon]